MKNNLIIEDFLKEKGVQKEKLKKIGWFCTYTPEELITASGFSPVRVMGNKNTVKSGSYFPINFCPYLKSAWESLLASEDGLQGAVFTDSCDGMRRLYDTAEYYLKDLPVFMLNVPRNTDSRSIDFYSSNLEDMLVFIEGIKGKQISNQDLLKALRLHNRKRNLLKEFSTSFFNNTCSLDISDYYRVMEISLSRTSETFLDKLQSFKELISKNNNKDKTRKPGIMIIGNFITEQKLWKMFTDLDVNLVSDDLCVSSRYYQGPVRIPSFMEGADRKKILHLIAERYLNKPACMRMSDMGSKISQLKKEAFDNDIRGIIFISLKFCDNVIYTFPLIRKEFAGLKIPVLYLEIEYSNFSEGQSNTRTQAFLEML
jgi:benzoyl-CoA reductase/2-hydroxyglutaryl-CoA dehydratase subunit BcrC/BadD/HgdB